MSGPPDTAAIVRRVATLATLLVALATAGCRSDGPVSADPGVPIRPLAVGNRWLNRQTSYDETGSVAKREDLETGIVGTTMIDGERWFQITRDILTTNRSDGNWMRVFDRTPYRVLKHPAVVGDTFHLFRDVRRDDQGTIVDTIVYVGRIESTSAEVVVPAGSFLCVRSVLEIRSLDGRVVEELSPVEIDEWAPGVGPVRSRAFADGVVPGTRRLIRMSELVSYELF